jgi:hypothetical protein
MAFKPYDWLDSDQSAASILDCRVGMKSRARIVEASKVE